MVDLRRHIGCREQAALLAGLDGHRPRADAGKNLPRQDVGHHAARSGVQHQRGGTRGCQSVVEPVHPEIGDGWYVDQDFDDQDQRDRQQQKLSGQPEPQPGLGPRGCRQIWLAAGCRHGLKCLPLRRFTASGCARPVPGSNCRPSASLRIAGYHSDRPWSFQKAGSRFPRPTP